LFAFIERRLIFKPTRHADHWAEPTADFPVEDVWLTIERGVQVHGWWCPTADWSPAQGATLYSHGNAGNLSHRAEVLRRWQQRLGQAVLIYDYPGYGRSTGKPDEPGCYAAAAAFNDWLVHTKCVAAHDVLLYGGSLGGAIAIELATRGRYRALIVVSAFTSVPAMARRRFGWLPIGRCIRNRFDNLTKIARCDRVFLAHGTKDSVIPFAMGEQLFAAAREPKQFIPMVDFDHIHTPGQEFYSELARFLNARN
jgi:hypothetical protein